MRILQVHKYFHDRDGAGRYIFDLTQLLEKAGHVVAPFAMHDQRNAPSVWDDYFVSTLETTKATYGLAAIKQFARAFWSREAKQSLSKLIKSFRPDVVHIHNIYTHLSPSILSVCKSQGIPVVMTVHDYALVSANYSLIDHQRSLQPDELGLFKVAKTRFIKGSYFATLCLESIYRIHKWLGMYDNAISVYLPVSNYVANILIAAGYSQAKIQTLPLFAGNSISGRWSAPSGVVRRGVLFAARLEKSKGYETVLAAAAALPEIDFYIAGTGPGENDIQVAASRVSNLHYLGFLPAQALWDKMAASALVVVPSLWAEPMPLVVFEAMACGTPVLASNVGGISEHVKEGETGYLYEPGQVDSFIKALNLALADPKKLMRMGAEAQAYVYKKASPDQHLDRLLQVYNRVLIHKE